MDPLKDVKDGQKVPAQLEPGWCPAEWTRGDPLSIRQSRNGNIMVSRDPMMFLELPPETNMADERVYLFYNQDIVKARLWSLWWNGMEIDQLCPKST